MKQETTKKSLKFKVLGLMFNTDKLMALAIFVVLGFLALQVPINHLAGSKASFSIFDLIAPISGAFLGTPLGISAVLLMQLVNMAFHGFANIDRGAVIRLFPILFGVLFFSRVVKKGSGWLLFIPLISIIIFNLNPVGRSVWYFSLYWTIPFLVYPATQKSLVARSLSATFVAHSVGGAIWIWAFHLPASVWQGLIPVVALERSIMAIGISACYILMNNLVAIISNKKLLKSISLDKKYLLKL